MKMFQNENVAFRCPALLKAKMMAFAEANDQHLSSFIRSACVEALRRQFPSHYPSVPTDDQINEKLTGMAR